MTTVKAEYRTEPFTFAERWRLRGYSVTADRIQCSRGDRWSHERCGILQVNVSKDTPDARSLVDAIIAAIDEPRASVGRTSNGSAVLLFRVDHPRSSTNVSFELPTGEDIEIIFGSESLTVAADNWTWLMPARERDALPPLRDEHLKTAEHVVYDAGARHPSEFERQRESERRVEVMRARLAAGETPESMEADRQHEEDLKLVERYAGQEPGQFDEMRAEIRAARYRVAKRAATAATAA